VRLVFRLLSGIVLLIVVCAILVVVIAPYTFLPNFLERAVARDLQDRLGTSTPPEVLLESDPQWRMLAGNFSSGRVELATPDVEGISPDDVSLDLDPFDVDVIRSVSENALRTQGSISGTVEARFSEQTLTGVALANPTGYPVRAVEIEGGLLVAQSEIELLGAAVPVSVGGTPAVEDNEFVFRPEEVRAMGVAVPEGIAQALLAGTDFVYPLGELPYGLSMDDARVEDGRLVVSGRVTNVLGGSAGA
jgi:hypothetical protein